MMIDIAKNIKLTYEKNSTRTIDHFKHKEQQTIMFACNLFGVDRQFIIEESKETNKEAKAIEVVSMINQENNAQAWWQEIISHING
jgi:hypothetical protein